MSGPGRTRRRALVLGGIGCAVAVTVAVGILATTGADDASDARATGRAAVAPPSDTPVARAMPGVWVSAAEIRRQPADGRPWGAIVDDALELASDGDGADLADQDNDHDQHVLAATLACVRTDEERFCDRARRGVLDAIGTEEGARWLAIGRNLTAYVVAADLLDLRADGDPSSDGSRVEAWLASFLTKPLAHNHDEDLAVPLVPFRSGSNHSSQEGLVYASIASYLDDATALNRAWDAYRTFLCDPTAPDREQIDLSKGVEYGWAHDPERPCGINPAGATIDGVDVDGAIINDMWRGGAFTEPPGYTQYPWVGLEGLVPAAVVFERAGYPAFEVQDQALLRALRYLDRLRDRTGDERWFDGRRADDVIHLVNLAYGVDFPIEREAVGQGRTMGYTDYTHPGPDAATVAATSARSATGVTPTSTTPSD